MAGAPGASLSGFNGMGSFLLPETLPHPTGLHGIHGFLRSETILQVPEPTEPNFFP